MIRGGVLNYERYLTQGAEEWLVRVGDADTPPILFIPPLFEEMNRTRALIVSVMRLLAESGYSCWLIDLPGSGESERALEDCTWRAWRQAVEDAGQSVAGASSVTPHVASLRGGALLDDAVAASSYWRFAPAPGASLVRDLERSSLVATAGQDVGRLELAGYALATELVEPLRSAAPADVAPLRTVRLASDRNEADVRIEGPALWRRSEPGSSPPLSAALAADLTSWIRRCASS